MLVNLSGYGYSPVLLGGLYDTLTDSELRIIFKRIVNPAGEGFSSSIFSPGYMRMGELYAAYAHAVDNSLIPIYNPNISDYIGAIPTSNQKIFSYLSKVRLSSGSLGYYSVKAFFEAFGKAVVAGEINQQLLTRKSLAQEQTFVEVSNVLPGLIQQQAKQIVQQASVTKPNTALAFLIPAVVGTAAGFFL